MKRFKVTYKVSLILEIIEHKWRGDKVYQGSGEVINDFEVVAKGKNLINFNDLENDIKIYYNSGAEKDDGKFHTRVVKYDYELDKVEELYDYADCTAKQCFEELNLADFMEMVKNEGKM